MSQRKCFKNETRACTPECSAYNVKPLDGTHCIELATGWSQARATLRLAKSIETATQLAMVAAGAAAR